jgi:quinol monooxygenase YgiN
MTCTELLICEAADDDLAKEVIAKMQDHVRYITGLIRYSILIEEGGRMVILVTDWPNRQDCLTYHSSKAYRELAAATQHMLIGSYVVKLFTNRTDTA